MRAAPALRVTVRRFAAWRAAVALLCATAAAALAGWSLSLSWACAAAVLAAAISLPLTRRAPLPLSWDGEQWHAGPDGAPAVTPRVMLDLGDFLLLRLDGAGRAGWLPVQRRGLDGSWHALRCALYSPRPAASVPPDDPASPR
jgi:hypothetical protein